MWRQRQRSEQHICLQAKEYASGCQQLEEARKDSLSETPEWASAANTLNLDFWPPNYERIHFSEALSLWHFAMAAPGNVSQTVVTCGQGKVTWELLRSLELPHLGGRYSFYNFSLKFLAYIIHFTYTLPPWPKNGAKDWDVSSSGLHSINF